MMMVTTCIQSFQTCLHNEPVWMPCVIQGKIVSNGTKHVRTLTTMEWRPLCLSIEKLYMDFPNRVPPTICNALANRNASKELNLFKQVLGLQICDWPTRCKLLETPYWEMPVFKNTNVDFILGWTFYLRELFWPDLFDVVRLVCLDISFQSMFAHVANF